MKSNSNFVCPVCGTNKKIGVNHEHQLRLGNQDIKESLLALGIDLDESLIDRMHRNLGAGLSFDAMARASGVINSRDEQSRLEKSDVSFRHWSPGNEDNLNASIEDEAYPLLQVDKQRTHVLLQDIYNRDSALQPRTRAAMERIVEVLRVQYSRNPDRFYRCLFDSPKERGKKNYKSLLLKTRYVDEKFFIAAIQRFIPDLTQADLSDVFAVMKEKTKFERRDRDVVDLWLLYSLITAEDQARRSFDQNSTQTARYVEFWNLERGVATNGTTNHPVRCHSANGRLTSKGTLGSQSQFDATNNPQPSPRCKRGGDFLSTSFLPSPSRRGRPDYVANLLGCDHYHHPSVENDGRNILGNYSSETKRKNSEGVPRTLNSPTRGRHPSPRRANLITGAVNEGLHAYSSADLFDGAAVASLMGREKGAQHTPRRNSYASLEKEREADSSLVAALGGIKKDAQAGSNPRGRAMGDRATSMGTLAAENYSVGIKPLLNPTAS